MFRNTTLFFIVLFLFFQPWMVPAQNLKRPLFSSGKDLPARYDTLICTNDTASYDHIRWQFSPNEKIWINIPDSQSDSLIYSGSKTGFFRAKLKNDSCAFFSDTTFLYHPKPEHPFFSISDEKEKLKIEWDDQLHPGLIDHYQLTIEGSDTIFRTGGAVHQLLIPRKMAYYHKKFTLEAIPSGHFTLPAQTACYENHYARFFDVRERLIAHRGLSARYPENTAIAFEMAADSGFSIVECDIRQTKDRVWVVNHDKTLNRTSNGRGYLKKYTLKELLQLNNGYPNRFGDRCPQQILTLPQLVTLCREKKIRVIIELKDRRTSPVELNKLVEMLAEQLGYDHFALQSFDEKQLKRIRRIDDKVTLGLISDRFEPAQIETLNDLYPCFYNVKFNPDKFNTPRFLQQTITPLLESGCFICLWKVNDPKEAERLIREKLFVNTDGTPGERLDEKQENH